jgi:hypothetical protein
MALLRRRQETVTSKPTISELGIDPAGLTWQRSGHGSGVIEIAFTSEAQQAHQAQAKAQLAVAQAPDARAAGDLWVLMRIAGDPDQRVLVFDRHEWECFLDGVRHGEFDDAGVLDRLAKSDVRPS